MPKSPTWACPSAAMKMFAGFGFPAEAVFDDLIVAGIGHSDRALEGFDGDGALEAGIESTDDATETPFTQYALNAIAVEDHLLYIVSRDARWLLVAHSLL